MNLALRSMEDSVGKLNLDQSTWTPLGSDELSDLSGQSVRCGNQLFSRYLIRTYREVGYRQTLVDTPNFSTTHNQAAMSPPPPANSNESRSKGRDQTPQSA